MKMSKILSILLVLVMIVSCFASCGLLGGGNQGGGETPDNGGKTEVIKIWVSELEGSTALAEAQIAKFIEANPEYAGKYTFEVSGLSEADAASQVLADIALAPDIFCFAQDQLARLVQAKALAAPGQQATANVKAANDSISISAASVAGTLYAYPLTSDNGYYMYYDTSVITNPDDLATIVADCEKAGKNICFELENAWYTASFFMATGCHSNWTMNEEGKFTSVDDDYNSAAGLAAMKGMQIVTKSPKYLNSSKDFAGAGVVITGIWMANTAVENLGENFGVTDLPSFTVDGETYHLGSFSGNKLMGVKPQSDPAKAAFLSKLAQYLTNKDCQLERYEAFQWGPSNLEAQADPDVKANVSLGALALQGAYAIPQGNIHGSWWDIAKVLGSESRTAGVVDEAGTFDATKNEADLKAALEDYRASIDALFEMTEEELNAWSVIGNICGSNWDTDFEMTEGPDGTFTSNVLALKAKEEFKVRQGASWDVNYGQSVEGTLWEAGHSEAGVSGGPNIKVAADGNYKVVLVINGDTATVSLVAAD